MDQAIVYRNITKTSISLNSVELFNLDGINSGEKDIKKSLKFHFVDTM